MHNDGFSPVTTGSAPRMKDPTNRRKTEYHADHPKHVLVVSYPNKGPCPGPMRGVGYAPLRVVFNKQNGQGQ